MKEIKCILTHIRQQKLTAVKAIIDIQRSLQTILKKWININPTKTLLFDANMNPLSSVKLNQRTNKILHEKKVSVNALRHAYLTENTHNTVINNCQKI